jgi:thiol-disulfide isomerase/thioredoxin
VIAAVSMLLLANIVGDVRTATSAGDLAGAERLVVQHQKQQGVTPESVLAYSWLARGALAAKNYDAAARYAAETHKLVLARVNAKNLDRESNLPIALGAAIEVQGHVLAAHEGRASAVSYLRTELAKYKDTSIRTRIQKNINLLSLEGKRAPKLEGAALPAGRPALLFFWAHWCPDCKGEAPVIARLQREFPKLAVIGPTEFYGYAEAGREVAPAEEAKYILDVQRRFYGEVRDMPAPVSAENFRVYGASTTPTLVLVDSSGIVRLYHPGSMSYEELRARVEGLR